MRFLLFAALACAACDFPRPPDVSGDAPPPRNDDAATDAAVGTPRCANLGYATLPWPETGTGPYAVTSADLNGDTKPDLAVVNEFDNTVSVLLGSGNGTFNVKSDYATGPAPHGVAVADVNGDAKPDLIVGNAGPFPGPFSMSVLLGNGDGTFGGKLDYPTDSQTEAIVVADVSGDGKPDVLVAGTKAVSVLLNNGNGTFAPKVDYTVGSGFVPRSLVIGDINSDGKPDIVLASSSVVGDGNAISIFLGNGNGTFASHVDSAFSGELVLWAVAIGDVNGDGKIDVVTGNYDTNTVNVLLGNGKGSFTSTVNSPTASKPLSLIPVDINGDGKLDLIVRGIADVTVMLGQGNGTFTEGMTYSIEGSTFAPSQSAVATDIDRDGKIDIVTTGRHKLDILLGHGDGTFAVSRGRPGGIASRHLVVADVNHDGRADVILSNDGATSVGVLRGNGDGTFAARVDYDIGSIPSSIISSDLNNDGNADLVVANSKSAISVLLGAGDGTFSGSVDYPAGPVGSIITTDINNDGKQDIVVITVDVPTNDGDGGTIPGSVGVLMGNGTGTFAAKINYPVPVSVVAADLNGDGHVDLVALNGQLQVSVMIGSGAGSFLTPVDYETDPLRSVSIADMNRDGKLDLVGIRSANIIGSTNAVAAILAGNGDGTFAAHVDSPIPFLPNAIVDTIGDRNIDLVSVNDFDSSDHTVSISAGSGNGAFQRQINYPIGLGPKSFAVADLNQDGQPDLIVNSALDNTLTVLLGTCIP